MSQDRFEAFVGFLFGALWAVLILGSLIVFKLFEDFGSSLSIFATVVYIVAASMLFLLLDAFAINRKRLQESQKQTQLLEHIFHKINLTSN